MSWDIQWFMTATSSQQKFAKMSQNHDVPKIQTPEPRETLTMDTMIDTALAHNSRKMQELKKA